MNTIVITIPASRITDWESFHSVFQDSLGFPDFYGRNMDAWIDCMGYIDDPTSGMTTLGSKDGEMVALRIDCAEDFMRRCPEQYRELIECTAVVNYRRISNGEPPVIALLISGQF